MELEATEDNVRIEVPQVPKKFNGLIAFSLNKEQYLRAEKFFAYRVERNLQLKIKGFVLEAVNDNKVEEELVVSGEQGNAQV